MFHFNRRVWLGVPLPVLSGAAHLLLKAVPWGVEQIMLLTPRPGKRCRVAASCNTAARPRSNRPAVVCSQAAETWQ